MLHTLAQLAACGTAGRQGRFHRDDVYMPIAPMFHVHAWGFPYAATVMGVKQIYPGRYAPDVLLHLIKSRGRDLFHCVPTILHMLLTSPAAQDVDLSRWKVVIGGSALPRALARMAMDRGIDIFAGYGMSETCPIFTLGHVRTPMLEGGSDREVQLRIKAGLLIPLVDLRAVDHDMNDIPREGERTGEIVVRAPWLTQGYLKSPEASAQLWAGGYLHTNDIGKIDTDGHLMITDRLKDVIKTGGEWISSLELEDIIAQHHLVGEVAVIGAKDEKWGERPMAVIVPKTEFIGKATADEIKSHVKTYSDIDYLVTSGFQVFAVSWRNPTPEQHDWNMDTYVEALLDAIDAARDITNSEDVNLAGACSGAMTVSALLGHLSAKGDSAFLQSQ